MQTFKEYLIEGDIISGDFGNRKYDSGLTIPKGYVRFYAKPLGKSGGQIIGIKKDKTEKSIGTTGDFKLAQTLADTYNASGKSREPIEQLSMLDAFGSDLLKVMDELNIKILEKPDYFDYIRRKAPINEVQFQKIKKMVGPIKEFHAREIFDQGINDDTDYPGMNARHPEEHFIIRFPSGNRYLVDTSGANSYIRNWAYLNF